MLETKGKYYCLQNSTLTVFQKPVRVFYILRHKNDNFSKKNAPKTEKNHIFATSNFNF